MPPKNKNAGEASVPVDEPEVPTLAERAEDAAAPAAVGATPVEISDDDIISATINGEPATVEQVMASLRTPPHVDDQRRRPYIVHLNPHVKPGRKVITLTVDRSQKSTFRRGGDKPDLENVLNLTPPEARQLRAEGWTVLEKE